MFRLLMLLAAFGTFVGVGVAALAVTGVIDTSDSGCPYGYGDSPSGSAASSCKSRPAPEAAQLAAAIDGSAFAKGLAAFKRSKESKAVVVGAGLNAYGETTFTIPDGENLFNAPEYRYVAFDRAGKPAPGNNAFRRKYAASTSTEPIDVSEIRPTALTRALARIRRGAPNLRFESAIFERKAARSGFGWRLTYPGMFVEMEANGEGLCAFGGSGIKGVKTCGFESATEMPAGGAGGSSAPKPPKQNKQLECIQKAAGDVVKMQKCITD